MEDNTLNLTTHDERNFIYLYLNQNNDVTLKSLSMEKDEKNPFNKIHLIVLMLDADD